MELRAYQTDILRQLTAGCGNDLVQLDTGAGKTPIEAALAAHYKHVMLLAHRNILIVQMSEKLARFGLPHDTISTEHTRRRCIAAHRRIGASHIERGHAHRLAVSVDSLLAAEKRGRLHVDRDAAWVIVIDEAHHVLPDNKWGRLGELFPAARFIGFTATPARMDGESLHVSRGGLFERLVQAEDLREGSVGTLISAGYLSDFHVWAPPYPPLRSPFLDELGITGDPVKFYCERFRRRKACMFCPSIKNSQEFVEEFRAAGVPAAHIGSDQTAVHNAHLLDAFSVGDIHVLTNVDMVSEGFDLPDIDVLILARRTGSFPAFRQWCGRALRPAAGKKLAHIVDHCGNVAEHGMPDDPVAWDIETPPRGLGVLKQMPCPECGLYFPLRLHACPACGMENPLLTRKEIGGFYLKLWRQFDYPILERARREYNAAAYEKRLRTEIVWPSFPNCGIVAQTVQKLRQWFVESLKSGGVETAAINAFLHSPECAAEKFWMTRFTVRDIGGPGEKARKVYAQWLTK